MMRSRQIQSLLFAAGCAWLLLVTPRALAQRVDHGPRARSDHQAQKTDADCDDAESADRREHRRGHRRRGRGPFGNPFRPLAQDQGPLQPGELEVLMAFAKENLAHVHAQLERLRERDPEQFEERMERIAPRLRQLRRLFSESPELADITVQHIANLDAVNQLRKPWQDCAQQPEKRSAMKKLIRDRLAENVTLETRLLALRLESVRSRNAEQVEADVAALLAPDADLAAEAEAVRELVADYHASADPSRQAEIRDALMRISTEALTERIAQMSARMEEMRVNGPEEVDRRLERTLRRFDSPERRRGREGREARDGRHGADSQSRPERLKGRGQPRDP